MKWKTKHKVHSPDWEKVFVFFPKKTQDGYTVMLQYVWRRYKVHYDSGKYVYVSQRREQSVDE